MKGMDRAAPTMSAASWTAVATMSAVARTTTSDLKMVRQAIMTAGAGKIASGPRMARQASRIAVEATMRSDRTTARRATSTIGVRAAAVTKMKWVVRSRMRRVAMARAEMDHPVANNAIGMATVTCVAT